MSEITIPTEIWDNEIGADQQAPVDWLWHGFLARGNVTLLTSLWKAGKTTLVSLLLARRKAGGILAGLAVKPGKSVIVSEESRAVWSERFRRYDCGGQACLISQPFRSIPRPDEWRALLDRLLTLHEAHGVDLAVVDPLAPFLREENHARSMLDTLLPLGELTRRGMAVLLLHHPTKGKRPNGQAARGSGALLGHVDISIEMRRPAGCPLTRRRRLLALSRLPETARLLSIELNPEGTDYQVLPDSVEDGFQTGWPVLRLVFEDAPQKLTREDIQAEWPTDYAKPNIVTLWRWLSRAVELGQIAREGTGRRTDPFRYWLPAREDVWKQDFIYEAIERQRVELNLPFRSLCERKRQESEVHDLTVPKLAANPVLADS
jgi:AAA domain